MPGGVEVERHGLQQLAQNPGLVTLSCYPFRLPSYLRSGAQSCKIDDLVILSERKSWFVMIFHEFQFMSCWFLSHRTVRIFAGWQAVRHHRRSSTGRSLWPRPAAWLAWALAQTPIHRSYLGGSIYQLLSHCHAWWLLEGIWGGFIAVPNMESKPSDDLYKLVTKASFC